MGYIAEVDLTLGKIEKTEIPKQIYDQLLSGKGLGAWYLYKNIPADADPLGPDNILGFVSGALTGTNAPICGRWSIVTKSPLTGGWGDANCGGNFSPAIKRCGVDAIFIKGVSKKPVYLFMDDDTCELRDASEYWGLDAIEAEERLFVDAGKVKKPSVALIGPAGEQLSLISGVCNEGGRIAARSGVGAVMGSKRLKAVVLAGSQKIACHDKKAMNELSKELAKRIKKAYPAGIMKGSTYGILGAAMGALPASMPLDGSMNMGPLSKWGSSVNTVLAIKKGDGPIKNWGGTPRDVKWATKNYNPDRLFERELNKYSCYSCSLGCGAVINLKGLAYGNFEHTHKPEYETIQGFGPLLLNRNLESVLYLNELLNRAGMDTISAANSVAYAIECYENGLIDDSQTNGLKLNWGAHEDIIKLVEKMIAREGIGDKLADGVKKAAEYFGAATEKFAMHVGGQEPGFHEPRLDLQLGVHFITEPSPGKHTIGSGGDYGNMALWDVCTWAPVAKVENKKAARKPNEGCGKASAASAYYAMLIDGAGGCYYGKLIGTNNWKLISYLNAATGWGKSGDEYMEIGKRIQMLRLMFNVKHGVLPASLELPKRIEGRPPLKDGPNKGATIDPNEQAKYHWKELGCDVATGAPLNETLEALGINELLEL